MTFLVTSRWLFHIKHSLFRQRAVGDQGMCAFQNYHGGVHGCDMCQSTEHTRISGVHYGHKTLNGGELPHVPVPERGLL